MWFDKVVVTNAIEGKNGVESWVDEAVGGGNSSCSSFEESRHPLSPTGYISLVQAFSSHSMGADNECLQNEDLYWSSAKEEKDEIEDDERLLPNLPESLIAVQLHDKCEHSSLKTMEGNPFYLVNASTKDALSEMLEQTINKMEESSKRLRGNLEKTSKRIRMQNDTPSSICNNHGSLGVDEDSREDINFEMVSSACGTLNLALLKSFPASKRESGCRNEGIRHPTNLSPSPYPLKKSFARLSAMQMHGAKVTTAKNIVFETRHLPENTVDATKETSCQDTGLQCDSSMVSAPDDEKKQDAQILQEEDDIVHLDHMQKSRDQLGLIPNHKKEKDRLSIAHSLSFSLKKGFGLQKGIQCHGGILSVASSE
jgi:hypothetical protein